MYDRIGIRSGTLLDIRLTAAAGVIGGTLVSLAAGIDYALGGEKAGLVTVVGGTAVSWIHTVGYLGLLLGVAGVAVRHPRQLGRLGFGTAYALAGVFGILAVVLAFIPAVGQGGVVAAVSGAGFVAMFLLSAALGVLLWRRVIAFRVAAVLMALPIPILVIAIVVGTRGWFPVHPALGEIPLYVGCAILASERLLLPTSPRPDIHAPA
jgi:hypothetical protein